MTRSLAHGSLSILAAALCAVAVAPPVSAAPDEEGRVAPEDARMPTPSTATIDDTLAIGGKEIDARKLRSRMTVEVRVNGTGPHRFVVDSGADTSVVGEQIALALRLPAAEPAILNSMTESRVVERVRLDRLELGPTILTDLDVPVLQESHIGAAGMIGLDALVEQRLMLDFDRRLITVDDARERAPRLDGEIVVVGRLQRGQLILTEVTANRVPIEAVVDTGTEMSIGNSALREKLLKRAKSKFTTVDIIGVTGAKAKLEVAVIPRLTIGPITLENVPIAFADVPPFEVFGFGDQPALLLGTDLMENFRRVSLDFRDRKVRFQLKRCSRQAATMRTGMTARTLISGNRDSACAR